MAIDPQKYIVFKREDFRRLMFDTLVEAVTVRHTADINDVTKLMRNALDDTVVLRLHDRAAAPALDIYAAIIALMVEQADIPQSQRKHLIELADFFDGQAEKSRKLHRKLPD